MPDYLPLSVEAKEACQPLFELGGRIATLLSSDQIKSSVSMQASLDDLRGAAYSLIHARHHSYAERNHSLGVADIGNVRVRATDISASRVRTEGKWTAGYYFNSALFRIAAVYHRILKAVAGKENEEDVYIRDLLPIVTTQFYSWTNQDWSHEKATDVYRQVNKLKHKAGGIYQGRAVTFDDAAGALTELLKLIEAWR